MKNFKTNLFLFTFLCTSPLYAMESGDPNEREVLTKQIIESRVFSEAEKLLQFQLNPKNKNLKNIIENNEDLKTEIAEFKKSRFDQHVFLVPSDIGNANSGEGGIANYLVGIQLSRSSKNEEGFIIDYI